ncbi:hypothetical protein V8G54_010624 [Vigna mungo]|uniref:Uncharacterized protein n=1 Tax=Vigna mungo TaxID=3915 RepID=A0AAQ3S520_VIGMU
MEKFEKQDTKGEIEEIEEIKDSTSAWTCPSQEFSERSSNQARSDNPQHTTLHLLEHVKINVDNRTVVKDQITSEGPDDQDNFSSQTPSSIMIDSDLGGMCTI